MSVSVIVGAQWGDEGKGKIVDLLSEKMDIVARYQGGPNAGHTVVVNGKEIILHQIPSGILWPHTMCVIGNGVVIDPTVFMRELEFVQNQGISVDNRLLISDRAHLILPYHRRLDTAREESQGLKKIGTTGRGIGPAYIDKVGRMGVRACDLLDAQALAARIGDTLDEHNRVLEAIYHAEPMTVDEIVQQCRSFADKIGDCITDTSVYLDGAIRTGKNILLEGAQGTMLDIDYGTYPFVTSSNPSSGGACVGLGLSPKKIDNIIGVVKAYTTRVGMGPFPTEFDEQFSTHIRQLGGEFGATTGRPRRCGWFDMVVVENAVRINGLTNLVITKLDVLDSLAEIKICVGYDYDGRIYEHYPADLPAQEKAIPVLESHPGWVSSTKEAKTWDDLPMNAQNYLLRISELSGVKISIISVGPDRNQTIILAS
ncbi:adenylosuccinate synthase [candidate division KSB1 bacterium]|nr:adenylosuccinate synthase [candidate division KSB1 bacterium]RQW03991.1 MAG: adenylosuccinate synthase [candidate division KSB1 bacterium]